MAYATALREASSLLLLLFLPASIAWSNAGGAVFYLLGIAGLLIAATHRGQFWNTLRRWPVMATISVLAIGMNLASILLLELRARDFALAPLMFALPLRMAVSTTDRTNLNKAMAGGAIGGAVAFTVAITEWSRSEYDPMMGLLNKIVFAQLVAICLVWALAGALSARSTRAGFVLMFGAGISVLAVVASGTRGAMLALPAVAGMIWPYRTRWRELSRVTRRVLALFILALILGTVGLTARSGLVERFSRIVPEVDAYEAGEIAERSVAIRLALWRASIEMAHEHPWFGVGANAFRSELKQLQARGAYPTNAPIYSHPHSTPLSVLAQYGLAGIALLSGALVLGWRALIRAPSEIRILGRTLMIFWCLMGMTNDLLAHQNTLRAIAFCWAVVAGYAFANRDGTLGSSQTDPICQRDRGA